MCLRDRNSITSSRNVSSNRISRLAASTLKEDRLARLSTDHNLAVFGKDTEIFWELVKLDKSVVLGTAGETDENVTVDVKRVIRHLGSLHGKCGLRVTEIPFERLDPDGSNAFDPLTESIVFSQDEKSTVEFLIDDVTASLGGHEISGSTGEKYEVSEALAIFLCLKGWAKRIAP